MIPTIHHGDMLAVLPTLPEGSFHACITDPPYHLTSIVKRFSRCGGATRQPSENGPYGRLSKGFMGKCYHPDTELLTECGWMRVGEVPQGMRVATLDPETRELEYQPVTRTHTYAFDGELVRLGHRSACQVVTPNHRVVLTTDGGATLCQVDADAVPRKFHLIGQARPRCGARGPITISAIRAYGKDRTPRKVTATFDAAPFLRFLGLWLGDGYSVSRANDHPANDFLGFTVKKRRKVEAIRAALQALGVRHTETANKERTAFYVYDFALLAFLQPLRGALTKRIPEWVLHRDASDLEHLYQGLMESDGCRQGNQGQEVFNTSSPGLADDFQRLCLHTGRSAIIHRRDRGRVTIAGRECDAAPAYVLPVLQPGKRLYAEARTGRGSDVFSRVRYTGPVHCVTVERHHTLYTRFEGKPVWSGNSWDGGDVAFRPETWAEVLRVLKPGAHLVAFGGTRTFHRMAVAVEDAGFEVRDTLAWLYGCGWPKSHNLDGAWQGWGTALKPAMEPIILARKPLAGTVAGNVLAHGTGALNVDACRIDLPDGDPLHAGVTADGRRVDTGATEGSWGFRAVDRAPGQGRWPANVLHDGSEEVDAAFAAFGERQSGEPTVMRAGMNRSSAYGTESRPPGTVMTGYADSGTASRFFFSGKATAEERVGSRHPTVKPQALMRWLARLVTPPGGHVLDPFAGSGSTGQAAIAEGFHATLIEREAEYAADIRRRFEVAAPLFLHAAETAP